MDGLDDISAEVEETRETNACNAFLIGCFWPWFRLNRGFFKILLSRNTN